MVGAVVWEGGRAWVRLSSGMQQAPSLGIPPVPGLPSTPTFALVHSLSRAPLTAASPGRCQLQGSGCAPHP